MHFYYEYQFKCTLKVKLIRMHFHRNINSKAFFIKKGGGGISQLQESQLQVSQFPGLKIRCLDECQEKLFETAIQSHRARS